MPSVTLFLYILVTNNVAGFAPRRLNRESIMLRIISLCLGILAFYSYGCGEVTDGAGYACDEMYCADCMDPCCYDLGYC